MSGPKVTATTAARVAGRLRQVAAPWDVYGERIVTYEIHFGQKGPELIRGPITLEGYGIRVLRSRDGKTAVGFQASNDDSDPGVASVASTAEAVSKFSEFPAKDVQLPSGAASAPASPEILDRDLWENAPGVLTNYVRALFTAFEDRKGAAISFGSVKAHCIEVTLANSSGLAAEYAHTLVESEIGVKAFGGPEGAAPGEYWVTSSGRRLDAGRLPALAADWARYAQDARGAKLPPSGELAVVFPPSVTEAILPQSIGYKLSGRAQLRDLAPEPGSPLGAERLTLLDDGTVPWAVGSTPVDDEGTPQRRRTLVASGKSTEILYDTLHGNALGHPSSGSGLRLGFFEGGAYRFERSPGPTCTTLVIDSGDGGSDAELIEAAGDGIWIQQIGWPSPDGLTTAFGGEIRIGYRIRNGKLAEPVRGGTLGGLVIAAPGSPSLLANVAAIGSKPELTGGVHVPTLLVRGLTVAGSDAGAATSTA
jgi:predicted Zn-dependent protease